MPTSSEYERNLVRQIMQRVDVDDEDQDQETQSTEDEDSTDMTDDEQIAEAVRRARRGW